MAKTLPQDYQPSNPPAEFKGWHRWIVDELHRISRRFAANPVVVVVRTVLTALDISPVPSQIRLGTATTPEVDFPGGDYDVNGVWTCPLDGLYMASVSVEIAPFGTGNKAYQADIVAYKNVVEIARSVDSAVDDVPLSVNMVTPFSFQSGDEVYFDLVTVHAQFTGATTYDYSMSMVRLGAAN